MAEDKLYSNGGWYNAHYDEEYEWNEFYSECHYPIHRNDGIPVTNDEPDRN